MEHVSIVVPTYREALNIPDLVKRISQLRYLIDIELLIVDDHSLDGIDKIVHQLKIVFPWLKLIERQKPRSLSWSVLEGCEQASHDIIIVMDADLSHPPEKIPEMVSQLTTRPIDFVIGSRYIANGSTDEAWPIPRRITSKAAALAAKLLLKTNIRDPLSGFLCFRKSLLTSASSLQPIGWKIGLELMVKCQVRGIQEVPIHFSHRFLGKSKLNFKVTFEYLCHLIALFYFQCKSFFLSPRSQHEGR